MKAMSMSDRGRNKDIEDVQWLVNNLSVKNSEELMKIVRDHWSTKQLEHYPLDYVQKIWTQVIVF
jgi:predicted transposase YbfD/YdcC